MVLYLPGVGSSYKLDQYLGGAFGLGLVQSLMTAYKFLVANYDDGDSIILFGFSRGGFAARSLASMLHFPGLLRRGFMYDRYDYAGYLYVIHSRAQAAGRDPMSEYCETFGPHSRRATLKDAAEDFRSALSWAPVEVAFLGVFDTVGSLGREGLRAPGSNHNLQLSPAVLVARQALAIDEHRLTFEPEIWKAPAPIVSSDASDRVKQVWFEGAHSDIGGGAIDFNSLSNTTLLWMLLEAHKHAGLEVAYSRALEYEVDFVKPSYSHDVHRSLKWWFRPIDLPRLSRQLVHADPSFNGRDRHLKPPGAWNVKIASSALRHFDGHAPSPQSTSAKDSYRPPSLVALQESGVQLSDLEEQVVWVPVDSVGPRGLRKVLDESFTHILAEEAAAQKERAELMEGVDEVERWMVEMRERSVPLDPVAALREKH